MIGAAGGTLHRIHGKLSIINYLFIYKITFIQFIKINKCMIIICDFLIQFSDGKTDVPPGVYTDKPLPVKMHYLTGHVLRHQWHPSEAPHRTCHSPET